jgi:hypothetical protein
MHGALGTALVFGGLLLGVFALVFLYVGFAGNHAFTPGLWAIVGLAGAVAIPSLVVGVRLVRRERSSDLRRRV